MPLSKWLNVKPVSSRSETWTANRKRYGPIGSLNSRACRGSRRVVPSVWVMLIRNTI